MIYVAFRASLIGLFVAMFASIYAATQAFAGGFFSDAWGVVTDPLKLDKSSKQLSASVDRSLIQLKDLENVTNAHVEQRLQQIRTIIDDAINKESITIDDALSRMQNIESKINIDAMQLLYRAQCAVEVTATTHAHEVFKGLIEDVNKSNPGISIFGFRVITFSSNKITIEDPDKAYLITKSYVLNKLSETVKDDTNAYQIFSAYQNLELAAKFTRCHYLDQQMETYLTTEVNEMERLSFPWANIVKVSMQR